MTDEEVQQLFVDWNSLGLPKGTFAYDTATPVRVYMSRDEWLTFLKDIVNRCRQIEEDLY